jgi:hypothetical protein
MKKNLRAIPPSVRVRLLQLKKRAVVAGCARLFKAEDLRGGALVHLGIELRGDGLSISAQVLPRPEQGKYSWRNIHGWEEVRKDLPIEISYHPVESPNWGDAWNGTHTVWLPHKAYPRDFHPPRELVIAIQCPNPAPGQEAYLIAARVDEVLDQEAPDFEERLLEDLNLLQENLGSSGVEPADISVADYASTVRLSWDILPPGSRDDAFRRLFRGGPPSKEQIDTAAERYDFFQTLAPKKIIVGSSGFRRYFGALLEDDLVVFENIEYGNAIYIMYDNWKNLSSRSRIDLLSGRLGVGFDRVIHKAGWPTQVRLYVERKREEKHH